METNQGVKQFVKSEQLWSVIKEFLAVLLGVTLAINFTSAVEKKQTQEKVIKMLDSVTGEITAQILFNEGFLDSYNEDKISDAELRNNAKGSTALIESILNNDTVIVTTSSTMYSMMINNVDIIQDLWSSVDKASGDDLATTIKAINTHFKNILWAIQSETKYLQGKCSEDDLKKSYNEYINTVYTLIDSIR